VFDLIFQALLFLNKIFFMVKDIICPHCGGELQPRGSVERKIRLGNGNIKIIELKRYSCKKCKRWQRELKDNLDPYKQYP